ncbi:trypsin-like serine protease, partial [Neoconidiobolus thromboides FSU 785]
MFPLLFLLLINYITSQHRIVNGDVAKPFSYTFIVSIQEQGSHFCGGSLLDSSTILTAAHCKPENLNNITVHIHRFDLSKTDNEESGFSSEVQQIINHEEYDEENVVNDISIWKLKKEISTEVEYQSVLLPDNKIQEDSKIKNLTVIGWGYQVYETGETAKELQVAKVKLVDVNKCAKKWKEFGSLDKNKVLCTKYQHKKQSICNGDSGGPLVFYDNKKNAYVQIGIVSFGEEKCVIDKNFPDGFVRVQSYLDWI